MKLDIYPFMQAGILRKNPNIKWGKTPDGSPWGPDRYNRHEDLDNKYKLKDEIGKTIPHLNLAEKKARDNNLKFTSHERVKPRELSTTI